MAEKTIAVLGTGMAGFGAGYFLRSAGVPFVCYDKNPYYGGHTRSIRYENGFVFDEGVHISFTSNEHVKQLLAGNISCQHEERKFAIDNYWRGRRIPHPVQGNLRGLPSDLIINIITDFIVSHGQPSNAGQAAEKIGSSGAGSAPETYADWLYLTYGRTFAETFPMAYGRKYHTTEMENLTTDWIGPRMYQPSLKDLLRGALEGPVPEAHYIQNYRYPSSGGFVSYLNAFARAFDIRLNHQLIAINPREKSLRFANGSTHCYSAVISTIPLPELIPMIVGVPHDVIEASRKLAFTTAILFNIGLNRADLSDAATTYFYDEDIIFSRINLPHLFAENNAPRGCGAIQAEVYFSDKYKPLSSDSQPLIDTVIHDLRRCGFIRNDDRIILTDTVMTRYANVIYDFDRSAALSTVHGFLDESRIYYCGRYGKWNHAWTDQAFVNGEETAGTMLDQY